MDPVTVALTLLEDVRWRGKAISGDRSRTLLATLAANGARPTRLDELISRPA
jgi:hypothetical protein